MLKTTLIIGTTKYPENMVTMTIDHPFPLSEDWLTRNDAVVVTDDHAKWCMTNKGCNCAPTGKEVGK